MKSEIKIIQLVIKIFIKSFEILISPSIKIYIFITTNITFATYKNVIEILVFLYRRFRF